jgi:YjjG family noncanonical pyrimidine nucleotidase
LLYSGRLTAQPNVRWTPSAREDRIKEYKLIFLDADDTLFDYKLAEKCALTRAFNEFGIDINDQILSDYSQINKQLWLDYENSKITQENLRTERFKRLFKKMGKNISEYIFSDIYIQLLAESSFLNSDAEDLCKYLHTKYMLAIITNGISIVQRNRLKMSRIGKYIDHIIISEDAKYSKPNIGIFQYAETITGIPEKDKMIIIGDSLSSDIVGGINYGIDTCWLNSENIPNITQIKPTFVVKSLKNIKDIL